MKKKNSGDLENLKVLRHCRLIKIVQEIAQKRQEEVYLVGGVLRDLLLKRPWGRDFDFLIRGNVPELGKEINGQLAGHFFPLDEASGIWRLVWRKGKESFTLDFSSLRDKEIEQDLVQRDFTINSLALNLTSFFSAEVPSLIDPENGLTDLKQKILRVNSENSFRADPLRMLRAYRLAAQLNLRIEEQTLSLIKKNKSLLGQTAKERVRIELFALLNENHAASFLRALFQSGILKELFPEIERWEDLPPGPKHDFFLLDHALRTVAAAEFLLTHLPEIFPAEAPALTNYFNEFVEEGLSRKALFKFMAFFHDSGKPAAYSLSSEESSPRFFDHDQKGKNINFHICQRMKMSRRSTRLIVDVTAHHMRILSLAQLSEVTPRAKFRFFQDLKKSGLEVALLALADKLASRKIKFTWPLPADFPEEILRVAKVSQELIRYYFEDFVPQKKKLLLDGREIMKALSLPPSKKIGELLALLREAENTGLIQTKAEALEFLKNIDFSKGIR